MLQENFKETSREPNIYTAETLEDVSLLYLDSERNM